MMLDDNVDSCFGDMAFAVLQQDEFTVFNQVFE